MKEKIIQARLKVVCRALGVSNRKFSLSIEKSASFVNSLGKTKSDAITTDLLSKISDVYPSVNKEYILEGKGSPLLDETDTLSNFTDTYQPEANNYKELCMAYRQALADASDEIKKLREAYFNLLENNNKLMESYSTLQAACLKACIGPMSRDVFETKKT